MSENGRGIFTQKSYDIFEMYVTILIFNMTNL